MVKSGQELYDAIIANDFMRMSELCQTVLQDVEPITCNRLKGLPDGNHNLGTVDAFKSQVESLIARSKVKAASAPTKGQFSLLIVTPSAPRAASLCGVLARNGLSVAKLFGRHLTVDEQAEFMSAHCIDVAVGTPTRLARLAAMGVAAGVRVQVAQRLADQISVVAGRQGLEEPVRELEVVERRGGFIGSWRLRRRADVLPAE